MKTRSALLVAAALALSACASAKTIQNPSQKRSTDPILRSVLNAFQAGCIENAPAMDNEKIKAGFAANEPTLAGGMFLVATGTNSACHVTVSNYGTNRPAPSYGDVNYLVQVLHKRVGGEMRFKTAESGAQVRIPGKRKYSIGAAVQSDGDLTMSLYH